MSANAPTKREDPARTPMAGDLFLSALAAHGVDYFFANPGTDFPPVVEAFERAKRTNMPVPTPVLVPHENLAVGMAHGAYLMTGRPQAVMVHVNVGTANTINNLANLSRERAPFLLAAGRSPITESGQFGSRLRQIHWGQEMFDQAGMVREFVKWDYELRVASQVGDVVARAFEVAMTSPQGPVYLTLPREPLGRCFVSVAGEPPITIPVMGLMQQDGSRLATEALEADGVTITFTDEQAEAPNPTGGLMSSFSSFGTSADLMFKPDVSAPGGSIYAPYPLERGGYATLSGTSMAAPHAAGAAALLLEADPSLSVEDVKLRLQNSSDQVALSINPGAGLEVVHRQGSGLIQVDRAIEADVTTEPGLVQLGQQLAGETSSTTVTVHNHTDAELTYAVSHTPATATSGTANVFGYWVVETDVDHPESITVPANGTADLTFSVTSPSLEGEEGDPMDPTFGGYLHLTEGDDTPAYSIAYGGSAFDLQEIEVLADMIDGDGNVTQELPALATVTSCEIWNGIDCVDPAAGFAPIGDNDYVFTMEQGEHPVFLVHFEHQARNMTWVAWSADEEGNPSEVLGTVNSIDYLARSATRNGFDAYTWDGMIVTESGARERLPSGDYVMQIDVTKASAWNDDREAGVETYISQAVSIDWSDEGLVDSPAVTRIEGHNRYATASELAVSRFEPGVGTVFIANGLNFPDAVAGGALAVAEEGPVLLTRAGELPDPTRMALQDLAPQRIVVLGGETVVTPDVMEALGAYAEVVERVAGVDRYRTAAAISQEWESSDIVLLASGMDFPDALSAAAAAGVEGAPVLLTRQHAVPGATLAELERLDPSTVYVIGGEMAVSDDAAEQAGEYADVVRLGGLDRYRTASTVAHEFFSSPTAEAFLATGRDFPDALAAAPAAAMNGGPVLLTRPDAVPDATMSALDALRAQAITLVGGFDAISLEVQQGLNEYVYQ